MHNYIATNNPLEGAGEQAWGLVSAQRTHGGSVPPRVYTVGNAQGGWPELVLFGVQEDEARRILNTLCMRQRAGATLPINERIEDVVAGLPVVLKVVPEGSADEMCPAMFEWAGDQPVNALQVVWPDEFGTFYWEPGFSRAHAHLQPILDMSDICVLATPLH